MWICDYSAVINDVPNFSEVKLNVWGHVYETRNNLILTNVAGTYIYIFVMYDTQFINRSTLA